MKSSYVTTAAFVVLIAGGCGQKTDNDVIAEAQDCLNKSTAATSLNCMSIVEGKTTTASSLIRCAAYIKNQGIADPANLIAIANGMDQGANGPVAMMAVLAFDDMTKMELAWPQCSNSGSKGLVMLASMSRMATAMLSAASTLGPNPTPAQVQAAVCSNDPATDLIVGQTAIVAFQQGCVGTNGASSNPYCDIIKTTGDTADPATIGVTVKDKLCPTP